MDKICNIKYVDAYYIYEKKIGKTQLSLFDAHGYVEEVANNIVIIFIKKRGIVNSEAISNKEAVIKGLVIPDTALMSTVENYSTNILKNLKEDSTVEVIWRDIVYVANLPRYDCSVMYSEGSLFRIEKDHIVLKDPETIRTYPSPTKNHPGSGRPTYLIIPISFITSIKLIINE
ncbi:MAG: hypothetical protein A2481_01225 [Candidatus Yonathbacteria bacterium RIFOXYC2_FULL_47_9]|nr:MAG: hypothetical protein A2481_01225 [Candidatus Yonathbacteria bacterium RIFOXYC2_FULL_47_9]HAT68066.1 hypothetical protein [Candidatus Yonathbacteria bacterium]